MPTREKRVDGGYSGAPVDYGTALGLVVEVVAKLAGQIGFTVLPRRWVVERTFAWINRCRRTTRDYERLPASHETMILRAMIALMARRLAQPARLSNTHLACRLTSAGSRS